MMAHLTMEVLGSLQVIRDGAPITRFESDKARALLVYLAVQAEASHRREKLCGLLWPDCPEQVARHNLSQTLFSLRQTIGDPKAKPPLILATREEIRFNPAGHYSLDLSSFNSHLAAVAAHRHPPIEICATCAQHLQLAIELYRGRFLEQFFLEDSDTFEEWAVAERESSHRRAGAAFSQLINYYEWRKNDEQVRQYASRQLELDPWNEEAHRHLMRALARSGQRSAALAQYEICRRVMASELNVEPAPETIELHKQIRAGMFDPVSPRQPAPPLNLPLQPTTFIGREAEVKTLADLLLDPECRLLTILGPGGIGKSRLAMETAAFVRDRFSHGVFFVSLAAVSSHQFVVPAIADTIGVQFSGTNEPKGQLLDYLRDKTMLLVLDNFEHLLDAGELLGEMLQRVPLVKLLVTSRERLNLQGEWLFDLRGLRVPSQSEINQIELPSAVWLLLERARRIQPGLLLKPEERAHVLRICQLVEGLPLAIELAATWVSMLSFAEIAREIERNLDFLTSTTRDLPGRHRSLGATFEQSWRLLATEERRTLSALAVLQGGFEREAAEQVAGASLPMLAALVGKSLVRRTDGGRYDLHEVIRQYARAHLADEPTVEADVRNRHAGYYLELVCRSEKALKSSALLPTLRALIDEIDNVRAAWTWAVEQEQWSLLGDSIGGFVRVFELEGLLHEGIEQVEPLVQKLRRRAEAAERNRLLGQALGQQGLLWFRWGMFERASDVFEESIALLRPLNDPTVLTASLVYSGTIMHLNGNVEQAQRRIDEAYAAAQTAQDDWFRAFARLSQGYIASLLGRYEEGYRLIMEGLAVWRQLGDPQVIALGLNFLSPTVVHLGRYAEAEANMRESLELCTRTGNRWGMATAYRYWGLAALAQGKLDEAEMLIHKSLQTFHGVATGWDIVQSQNYLAEIKAAKGDTLEAKRLFTESVQMGMKIQALPLALDAMIGLADLCAQAGEHGEALELSICVANHPSATRAAKQRGQALISELEPRVDQLAALAMRQQGALRILSDLVNQADLEE